MPVRSGFEATALIRKHELEYGLSPVPIIALTAHAMIGYRVSPLSCCLIIGKMFGSRYE
jgi:CheY-like chemotaxis protein